MTLLVPDVYVLVAPGAPGHRTPILRINTQDAAKFAFAADNMKLWLVLRPAGRRLADATVNRYAGNASRRAKT